MKKYSIPFEYLPSGYGGFFEKLTSIPDGVYSCSSDGVFDFNTPGWIGVSRKSDNGEIELLWTSHKEYHLRHYSSHKAVMADFFEDKIEYVMQAAFSMWPVRDQEHRVNVVLFLMNRMNNAIANMERKREEPFLDRIRLWAKNIFSVNKNKPNQKIIDKQMKSMDNAIKNGDL